MDGQHDGPAKRAQAPAAAESFDAARSSVREERVASGKTNLLRRTRLAIFATAVGRVEILDR